MVSSGDQAPTFSATIGTSDHEPVDLATSLGDGPVVLAFFPGAFTPPCTNEMVALQEHAAEFAAAGATVYGISADSPFSQGAFREGIGAFDLEIDIAELGLHGIANRAVSVLDEDGSSPTPGKPRIRRTNPTTTNCSRLSPRREGPRAPVQEHPSGARANEWTLQRSRSDALGSRSPSSGDDPIRPRADPTASASGG